MLVLRRGKLFHWSKLYGQIILKRIGNSERDERPQEPAYSIWPKLYTKQKLSNHVAKVQKVQGCIHEGGSLK